MMRLLRRAVCRFAEMPGKAPRGLAHHLKAKKAEAVTQAAGQTSAEDLAGAHRLLYVQFLPAGAMAFPLLYFLADPTSAMFSSCLSLLQYYLSGLLCFNSFFAQTGTARHYGFIGAVAAVNCLTGAPSLLAPVLLAVLNLWAPFTDEKYHKFETESHEARVKAYLRVQGLFYFLVALLLTLKFYHYEEVRQLELKLTKFQAENTAFLATLPHK